MWPATVALAHLDAHTADAAGAHSPQSEPIRRANALGFLLEGLIPLARFVGGNPIRLLVAIGMLADEEIDAWVDEAAQRNPPSTDPPPPHDVSSIVRSYSRVGRATHS
jgi:hypothetical protein